MVELANTLYTVGFFVFVVGGMLYIVWKSLGSEMHSPSTGGAETE
jgi:hypothetical protein